MNRPPVQDLLIEIGTEELPASAQAPLANALAAALVGALAERSLAPAEVKIFSAPRRLAVLAHDVPALEPDRHVERKGPSLQAAFDKEGRPTPAALGFARSVGIAVDRLEKRIVPGDERLVHRQTAAGRPTVEVLASILPELFTTLPLPQRMRWGTGEAAFLRPVRWLVVRYGKEAVAVKAFGLTAEAASRGHRLHHPGPVTFAEPTGYAEALGRARVIADSARREAEVRQKVAAAAREIGGNPAASAGLYTEIAGLVEWPVALTGCFDTKYLALPDAVLVTTLAHHQRLVPIRDNGGALQAKFVAVIDLESHDTAAIRHGLERVVHSRLEDAAFYYRRDRERALADYTGELSGLAFAPGLGSMADKADRLARLTAAVAESTGADTTAAARAGALAKCDLVTGLVFEFPELQGVMGGYYASESGEESAVAKAIAEQYLPAGTDDALPQTPVGAALALADRLDTLIGGFATGLQPTGTRDPFGLRRVAFGLLRIAAEQTSELNLDPLLNQAACLYPLELQVARKLPEAKAFLRERLRSLLLEEGQRADTARAVLAVAPLAPGEVRARVAALADFRSRPEAASLAAANKRIANILRQAGTIPENRQTGAVQAAPAEQALAQALDATRETLNAALKQRDFASALEVLAGLREPVDRFFDEVLVMASDPALRARRLGLLARLRAAFLEIADIGELQDVPAA